MDIKKAVDLHVHVGPEIVPRKFRVEDLVRIETGKIGGIAIKSHTFPTMPLVKSIKNTTNLRLIGSITLNSFVGGINAAAVYASAELAKGPIIVWFPTIHAENTLEKSKWEIPLEWFPLDQRGEVKQRLRLSRYVKGLKIVDRGEMTEEAKSVLKVIRDYDLILATGHVSWGEAKLLVEKAIHIGIKKIVLTHPIYKPIHMPVEIQKELTKNEGVFVEHSYSMHSVDKIPIRHIAQQIKEVGAEHCILTSDVGQIFSPNPSQALEEFTKLLLNERVSEKDLEKMLIDNPYYLISKDRG